jgi:diadenosine tetraphosphatase ApaH/serine/threonine PP2A family protein phosphatase
MRVAVLSDIHSNLVALDAVLDDLATLPSVDATWVCGDIVGYGPQPNEVIARLREIGALAVMGNHDGAAVGVVDPAWFNDAAAAAISWTTTELNEDARAFLADLPERRVDGELTAVHGSPRDPIWEYITSTDVARANLDAYETRICLFGHTHLPIVYADTDGGMGALSAEDEPMAMPGGRLMLNPGSVGQPRDGDPRSSYAVLDLADATATFRRVPYDIARTQELMRERRLPNWLVERLSHGR